MESSWKVSSYSQNGGNCVEVRETPHTVQVRDTKNRRFGHIAVPTAEWRAFVAAVRAEEL